MNRYVPRDFGHLLWAPSGSPPTAIMKWTLSTRDRGKVSKTAGLFQINCIGERVLKSWEPILSFKANASLQSKSRLVTSLFSPVHLCGLRMLADIHFGWSVPMPFWLGNILNLTSAVDCSDLIPSAPAPSCLLQRLAGQEEWRGSFLADVPVPGARAHSPPAPALHLQ